MHTVRESRHSNPLLLGRVALVRSVAAYSHQTFPWTICRSVNASDCPVHCEKTADRIRMPFGIRGRTGPGMRQVVGFGICVREGVLLGANLGRAILTNADSTAYVCDSVATRPCSQITLGKLVSVVVIVLCRSACAVTP